MNDAVSVLESGIASVGFNCQYEFEGSEPYEEFSYFTIMDSDKVVGFPEPTEHQELKLIYYYPGTVDLYIENTQIIKVDENSASPVFIKDAIFTKFDDDGFDSFKISGNLDSVLSGLESEQIYSLDDLYLVYPKETPLHCSFSYDGSLSITFICRSNTKIESGTIIFDQRILKIKDEELYFAISGKIIDTTEPADEEEEKNVEIEEMKEEKEETKYFNEEKNEEFLDNISDETFNNEENESINESEEEEEEKVDEAKESEKSSDETSEEETECYNN